MHTLLTLSTRKQTKKFFLFGVPLLFLGPFFSVKVHGKIKKVPYRCLRGQRGGLAVYTAILKREFPLERACSYPFIVGNKIKLFSRYRYIPISRGGRPRGGVIGISRRVRQKMGNYRKRGQKKFRAFGPKIKGVPNLSKKFVFWRKK